LYHSLRYLYCMVYNCYYK